MKAFIKNCLKIAGIFIVLGILLIAAGYSMDDSVFNNGGSFNFSLFDDDDLKALNFWDSDENNVSIQDKERLDGSIEQNADEENHAEVFNEEDDKVPGRNVVSEAGADETAADEAAGLNYNNIKSLYLDITYGTLIIKSGDHFDIQIENIDESDIENKIEDGVWIIKDYKGENNSDVSLLGFHLTVNDNAATFSVNKAANIEITVPENQDFENIDIKLDAGSINADRLYSKNAYIDVGAGKCEIDELQVSGDSSYSVGTGELVMENIDVNNADFDCGVGHLSASGIISGDNYVTCGIGNVNLDIDGDFEDYNYKVNCGVGSVTINNDTYSGVNSQSTKNEGADNNFSLECGIGKISLSIK